MTDLTDKKLRVMMNDGSVWEILVRFVIENRATVYEDDFDTYDEAIADTIGYFSEDPYRIKEWACNIDWIDIQAIKVEENVEPNYSIMWFMIDESSMEVV